MNKVGKIIGIIVGIAIFIAGFSLSTKKVKGTTQDYPKYAAFGADYYTESYAAMRATALNVADAVVSIERLTKEILGCFGAVMMAFGAATAVFYTNKLADGIAKEREEVEQLIESTTHTQSPALSDQWTCSHCGTTNSANHAICKKCGQYKNG